MGDNLAWPGEGHRVEFERGLPRIAVRPDFQGRSGLVQAQNFEKVADREPAEVGPYAYVDLVGHLGAWRTVTNGSSAITTPISERDGLNADAGRNGWGMQGAWPVEDIESLSDGCSGSHDASLAELQRLSLSSDHHPDHPMAKSLSPNHHVDRLAIKVKFMCSFGGKILPRPSDGKLRYVGGETRIITVNKGIGYGELMQKLTDAYGQALLLKYQLPNEDLDALVSVSSDEDFENMMEEYDRLEGSEGLSRLRVFLFSVIDYDLTHFEAMGDGRDSQQRYVDAVNSFPETGFRKHADSMKSASLQQSEKCSGPTRAQSIPDSLPSVQIPQDVTDPVHLLINVPHPSKQAIASTSIALDPSSPLLSSLPTHTEQSGVADIPVPIIPVQPLKFGNRSYSTLRLPEGCQDLGFGGCAISQQELHRRLPQLRVGDMPTKVPAIFSLPASNQDLIYSVDQQVDDPKLSKVGSSGKLANSEKQIQATLPTLDHGEDVQLLPVDPQLVVLQHPHSMHQSLRQHQLDAHQDSYSSGDYNQQARFDGGPVRQSFQQHAPLSAHLNGHEFPNNETVTFQHADQALQSPDDVFGGPPFQKVVSVRQLGHVVPAAATLQLVGSDPSSPCFAGRQRAEVQQHVQVQRTPNASSFNPQQYETIVCHYDVQASRAFCPLTSPIGYCEIMGEQFACQNTSPQKLQSNYEDQFGCQQAMQHENVCHSSEHTMQPQETSHVYSGNFVPQHGVKSVHPTYEGTVSSQVHHSDGAVRPVLSYGGPSILQEETMPHQDNWELGGVSAPQERKREPILSEQQCYTMMPGSSGYLVQHIPKVLGSVQAEPVGSYVGMDVSENLNPFLGPELDESCRVYQKSEIFEPFVGTSYQLKQPTSAEQHRDMGILPQALQASELTRQIKDALVPSRVPSAHEVRTAHPLTEHVNSHPVIIAHSETEGRDTLIQVPAARVDSCIQQTWWGDRLDTDLAKGEGSVYLLGQRGNISEDGPKDASHIHKMLRPSDSHDTSSLDENINNLPCVPQNHPVEVAGKSLMDNTDAHSAYAWEDSLLNTSIDELKETSPNSEALAWSHDISDSDMSWVLPLEKSASTTILTCKADESSVCMQPRATDCASLSSYTSVSLDVLTERGGVGQMHATMQDSSDEYVKVELQNVAEDVAEAVLRPTLLPAPTLSVHQWDQINEDVKVEEHISQVNEGAEEENVTIEDSVFEEVKTEDSDNDDHVTDAVIAEAEAIFHGLQTIKNADLEELRELGSGTFGTVYHGKWRGSDVAIKRIKNSCFSGRPSHQEHLRADFWSEARMLAQLHHPNVVAFYGVVPDGPGGTLGTVTEYMVNGSLKLVLQRKDRTIDRRKRLLIAMDAAFGMEYLHGKNIVHFDLKCENLLVNMRDPQRPICKVADFGLSKIKHQTLVSGGVRGTLPWMAPELLNGSSSMVSEKVDVYSYGIVMWELLTGEEPYANMHYGAIIGGIVSNTLRPPVPNWCDTAWRLLMEWCWSADPAARPSFTEIANELRAMRASFHPRGQVHQASVQAHAQKQS